MRNSNKNREKDTIGQSHHNPQTRGLITHDQSKTSNPIQNRHKHTYKAGTMITIHPYGVIHSS